MKLLVDPKEALSAALTTILEPQGMTIPNMQSLYAASRLLVTQKGDPGSIASKVYSLMNLIFASLEPAFLIHGLKLLATLCHYEPAITDILTYDSINDTQSESAGELFSQFGFSTNHGPSDRLIMLILGFVSLEVYQSNLSLFHAAILALEGFTFYSQGKKKVLLSGGLQTISSIIEELHVSTDAFNMRNSSSDISLALLETLSNIITYRFARVLAFVTGERVLEMCAEGLCEPLVTALVTAYKTSQTYAIISCILPCLVESEFFYQRLSQNEQAISAILNVAVSGSEAGNRAALLSLLILSIDATDPTVVTKLALHGEVGEEAVRAQAEAEAALNEFRSRSPSPMRQLYKSKALLSAKAEERCELILSILQCLLDHDVYISLSNIMETLMVDRSNFKDIFYGNKQILQAEIDDIRSTIKDLLFALCIDEPDISPADQPKYPLGARTAPRAGAQSRLEMHSTGHKPSAFRKLASHMSIDLSKTLF